MKTYRNFSLALLLVSLFSPMLLSANNGWNDRFPGDDFSLEGALQLFKNANTLEDFEQALNSPNNDVNNLDLNYNGKIDYLRVVDHQEGDVHAIVIQDQLDHNTFQDVAVIEVKRTYNGEAMVQIIGDVDLYGTERIVEPYPYDDQYASSYHGYDDDYYDYYDRYNRYDNYSSTVFVNVMLWPSVRYIYSPRYVVWVSPWYWGYYPHWYTPWQPQPWNVWHTRTIVYRHHYRVAPQYRIPEAHRYYAPRRKNAPAVHERTQHIVQANGGRADNGRSRNSAPNVTTKQERDRAPVANTPSRKSNAQRETAPVRQPRTDSRPTDNRNMNPSSSRQQEVKQPSATSRKTPATIAPQASRSNSRASENSRGNGGNVKSQTAKAPSRSTQVQTTPSAPRASSPKTQSSTVNRSKTSDSSSASGGKATSAKQSQKQSRKQ